MTARFCLTCVVETGSADLSRHLTHHNHILLFQKARQAYLAQFGYTEQNIEGLRMFVVEVRCTYKRELFHQDKIDIRCQMDEIKNKVFSMSYTIEREGTLCALGMSKSVCAEPGGKKAVSLPHPFVAKVSQYERDERF